MKTYPTGTYVRSIDGDVFRVTNEPTLTNDTFGAVIISVAPEDQTLEDAFFGALGLPLYRPGEKVALGDQDGLVELSEDEVASLDEAA